MLVDLSVFSEKRLALEDGSIKTSRASISLRSSSAVVFIRDQARRDDMAVLSTGADVEGPSIPNGQIQITVGSFDDCPDKGSVVGALSIQYFWELAKALHACTTVARGPSGVRYD